MKLEELQKQLDEVYQTPIFKSIQELEKDKKSILATSTIAEMANMQKHELEKLIGDTSFQNAFKSVQDYTRYTSPILDSLQNNNFQELQDSIAKSYEPFLKPQISETLKALAESQMKLSDYANIGKFNIDDYLGTSVQSALENIKVNENLLDSSKVLNSVFGQIDTNIFKDKINDFEEQRKLLEIKPYHFHERLNIEIPKNPILDVIEQNEKIIGHLDLQNKSLNEIAKYLANQNEKLDTQNNITEQQIKENDQSAKKALWIAVGSIVISIIATFGAILVSYDIYTKEDISDNTQHKELLQTINKTDDVLEQNRLLKELVQEVRIQNKLLVQNNKTEILNEKAK